jgi:HK97 family phage major capsid protein
MGRPVIPVEYCSTMGSVGDVILMDPSQYLMINKGGLKSATSIHVRFLTDEMTLRFTLRTDGEPTWHSALTPYKGVNTLSPFVTLAVRP